MNMKNRKNQDGSLMTQVVIVIMLVVALLMALMSIHMLEYKKNLKNDMQYQAQLCAKSSIEVIVQLLNEQDEHIIPPQGESLDVDIHFSSRLKGNSIGEVTEAKLYWDNDVLVIKVSGKYMSSEATMKGYVQNQEDMYQVKYYENE